MFLPIHACPESVPETNRRAKRPIKDKNLTAEDAKGAEERRKTKNRVGTG